MMQDYNLFNKRTQAIFYNLKAKPIQRMLDFDYLSGRETPSIAAIVHPGRNGFHKVFFGKHEILIPIYGTIKEAAEKHPGSDALINFASYRSAYQSSKEGLLTDSLKTVTIVAEGIPERQMRELIVLAKKHSKIMIGPATVGGLIAGKLKIGHASGMTENIIRSKLYIPGSVGLVSRSGGMMNELLNIISRATDGVYEGIAIGGDVFPGSTLLDHMLRYEANPEIKMIVALGEIGGSAEYEIIEAKNKGRLTKPIVMWVSGTCANIFPWKIQFGHAGAKAGTKQESAETKNQALRDAGIIVPEGFETFEETIAETFKKHVQSEENMEIPPTIPERKQTNFTSTISDGRGDEPLYNGVKLSEIVAQNGGIGDVIGLLWFKKKLPTFFSKFIDLCIILTADHGPAVSTAHNAIVASRAGKDLISSLISGLSTIGPRHGGAIDGACRYFKKTCDSGQDPVDFVKEMKSAGIPIPGIGHRVKSIHNPDKRVEILQKYAAENFPSRKYLEYALRVEEITLKKADNLILNVDGCIGVLFLDAMEASGFSAEEVSQIVSIGYLNGLFAIARSIGMIGHILDQKRLGERMYRHPVDDILYAK